MSGGGKYSFGDTPSVEELAAFTLNDAGNARRFIRHVGGRFNDDGDPDLTSSRVLFLRKHGWIAHNGKFWDPDVDRAQAIVRREAVKVMDGLIPQMKIIADNLTEKDVSARTIQKVWDFAEQCGNHSRISSMLNFAQAFMGVDHDAFDFQPMALNCDNGVIWFVRDAEGKPYVKFKAGHDPSDRMTRVARGRYDPDTPAAVFERVVRAAQPNAPERDYLQRVLGYAATGSVVEQKLFILQGKGGDGKSTIINACRHALGSYAKTVAIETFLDTGPRRGGDASPDIADMKGDSRMLCSGEPPAGSKLATGAIKQFTGGGAVKARELREGLFEFDPVGKPFIECNRRPVINDTDRGIWRRLKVILFPHSLSAGQVDNTLPDQLKGERDGILTWIVAGTLKWMTEGLLNEPESVKAAIEDYQKGSNPMAQWMADRLVLDAEARVRASDLYADYKRWMEDNGYDKPVSQKSFGGILGDYQIIFAGKDGQGKVTRRGARLRTEDESRAGLSGPSAGGGFDPTAFDVDDL